MKIIDFAKKGNVVRFYLGEKTGKWGWTNPGYVDDSGRTPSWLKPNDIYYGDDWDDTPYEHNAGMVYEEFIQGYRDIAFGFDDLVLEPCDDVCNNSRWCKNDMRNRCVPCIIVVSKNIRGDTWNEGFSRWVGVDGIKKFYFGDEMEPQHILAQGERI